MYCWRKGSSATATMPPTPLQTACKRRAARIILPCRRKRARMCARCWRILVSCNRTAASGKPIWFMRPNRTFCIRINGRNTCCRKQMRIPNVFSIWSVVWNRLTAATAKRFSLFQLPCHRQTKRGANLIAWRSNNGLRKRATPRPSYFGISITAAATITGRA